MERRYMRSMQKKMTEWYKRTKLPALCLAFRKGQFWIATDVPQVKGFAQDVHVQQAFLRQFRAGFNPLPVQSTVQQSQLNEEFPKEYDDFRVTDLRKMVIKAVMSDGRARPNWGKPASRPRWWPCDIPFMDVNNHKTRPRMKQLLAILNSFKEWKDHGGVSTDSDDLMEHDEPQSPEVPIAVEFTPPAAETSSTSVQCTSTAAYAPAVEALSTSTPLQRSSAQTQFTLTSLQMSSAPTHCTSTPVTFALPTSSEQPVVSPIQTDVPSAGLFEIVRKKFGARSVYVSDLWKSVLCISSNLNATQTSKLLHILGNLNEDSECDVIINANAACDILKCMERLPWDVNRSLCEHILKHFPFITIPEFPSSEDQQRLPERFLRYVLSQVHDQGLEPFYSSGDGNCFYNSISSILTSKEESSVLLQPGAAWYGLAHYDHIVQTYVKRFSDKDDALQWGVCVSLSTTETATLENATATEIITQSVKQQVVSALKNYTDIGILQVSFTAGLLKVPIHQHCVLEGAAFCNTFENPPCCFEGGSKKPLHVLWLPLTAQGNSFNHISPLPPWKCKAMVFKNCIFWHGFNSDHKLSKEMVQCLTCNKWYHCSCLGISLQEAKDSTIMDCGCLLPCPYRSSNMSLYSNKSRVFNFLTTSYLKSLTTKLLVEKSVLSLRLALNMSSRLLSQRRVMVMQGTGPIQGQIVDLLVERLTDVAAPVIAAMIPQSNVSLRTRLLMDVILPESIIRLVMHLEDINYFRACQFFQSSRTSSP